MSGKKVDAFDREFWKGKRVWVSGHTGFKGAWLCAWLTRLEANVMGTALGAPSRESLAWTAVAPSLAKAGLLDHRQDIQNATELANAVKAFRPHIAMHLAAQAIVLDSYVDMSGTWGPNVMGTLSALQAASGAGAQAFVAVTSDKCYANKGWDWGYRETDELGGADPYSASKAACEILVASWRASASEKTGMRVASARAGNVIGGGDNAPWRILPEMLAAFGRGEPGHVRNPESTRPFQHALEPLSGYMLLARRLFEQSQGGARYDEAFNFGPEATDGERSARWLAAYAAEAWGDGARVELGSGEAGSKEARVLMLDSSKARKRLGWDATWGAEQAVQNAVAWEKRRLKGAGAAATAEQIQSFENDARFGARSKK